jgi:hypothetical protein
VAAGWSWPAAVAAAAVIGVSRRTLGLSHQLGPGDAVYVVLCASLAIGGWAPSSFVKRSTWNRASAPRTTLRTHTAAAATDRLTELLKKPGEA